MARKRLAALLKYLPDPVFAFSLDNEVEYVNPAFERVFGWTLEEIKGRNINFIPEHLVDQAREGMRMLYKNRSVHDFETQRYTKDGRILDILINGAILYDEEDNPVGQALILRDKTREKRMAKSNQVMFNISRALHQYHKLGDLIAVITREINTLVSCEGAFILLGDEERDELYFLSAQYRDGSSEKQFKKIRFSPDQGVSGRVYRTGKPLLIPDVSQCSFYLNRVDEETDLRTKSMLSVPMMLKDRIIGVVSVVNKQLGEFDDTDTDLLSMVASTIALPIENTRINEQLRQSYRELQTLNRTKDQVINHLAHELKTPVSVIDASMKLLSVKLKRQGLYNEGMEKMITRTRRNLSRLLDIQYEVEDLLREKQYQSYPLLQRLVQACRDELITLVDMETPDPAILDAVEKTIDEIFGPENLESDTIDLQSWLENHLETLKPSFTDRKVDLNLNIDPVTPIDIPEIILTKVINGVVKNAVEYTPDGSKIDITLAMEEEGPHLTIKDSGIGITQEKLNLIFDNYFTPPESMDYSTREPYEFNAGGRGFDLLRIKLFSEQYGFSLNINSKRCPVIPSDADRCPGNITDCSKCNSQIDCVKSGGTAIHIRFNAQST
ncbi:MAG: PAS domain S-box protein [Desulfobacteraceae bacterium]|nr:MAG: PAS domain S-box protein [Desulfobacteraceae bacterium]